ncbi:DUF6545 domain-containing protein [Actinosynnema sp. CA-248983]
MVGVSGALSVAATAAGVTALIALSRGRSAAGVRISAGVALLTAALPITTVDRLAPVSWPLQHVLALGAAYLIQSGFARATNTNLRGRLVAMWVAAAIIVGDFVADPRAPEWHGGTGVPSAAHIAFGAYLAHAVATLFVLSRRSARLADAAGHRLLATGMRVHALGEAPLFLFSIHMVAYHLTLAMGTPIGWPQADVERVLMPLGTGTVLVGLSMSAFSLLAHSSLADWWRYERHRRRVHPLWTAVVETIPDIGYLDLPTPAGLNPDAALHAYRTVVDLRDALVVLCQLPGAPRTTNTDSAVVAAAIMAHGLLAWQRGERPDNCEPAQPPVPSAATPADELRWWARVHYHMRNPHTTAKWHEQQFPIPS